MRNTPLFQGVCTALATPFIDGKIDYRTLEKMINYQIDEGIPALLLAGTTGEASTLSREERRELGKIAGEMIGKRAVYIVGCGSNSTSLALEYSADAVAYGADAILLVTPYYNKATEEGLILHYQTIAEAIPLPQILYHVPSRTGVHFTLKQIAALSQIPNIVGIKEADSNLDWLQDEMAVAHSTFSFYAGNDSLAIPTLSLGGIGVFSVISNIYPREMRQIVALYQEGKTKESLALQQSLLPFMRLLFKETNPAPLKHALAYTGFGNGELRLPLSSVTSCLREEIEKEMDLLKDKKIL